MRQFEVVMPAYNEAAGIAPAVEHVIGSILDRVEHSRLIVVNDGSRDATGEILRGLTAKYPLQLKVVSQTNKGHGPALYHGIEESEAPWLLLLDADEQIDLGSFPVFWAERESADLIIGRRVDRQDPPVRLAISRVLQWIIRLFLGTALLDANVPFKLVRRTLWLEARQYIGPAALVPSAMLAVAAKKLGYRVKEIPVRHAPRRSGEVKLRKWRLLVFSARAFGELLAFSRRLSEHG